ncbi:hypothetical protein CY34DRAFT_331422 [Suillus luteus UH-Slu-Lm8-n1]|uniref:Uncharacterized protein n=1 Tax=Suillus luteus UH-Slu-Lm8-n1 TaxID=930992 RepID=A0A0D0AZ29_9AGAM|nr:hypothetical protein CY34DRAFT_331422 [Suillus luteus UH-Slu-Lm8-n1]
MFSSLPLCFIYLGPRLLSVTPFSKVIFILRHCGHAMLQSTTEDWRVCRRNRTPLCSSCSSIVGSYTITGLVPEIRTYLYPPCENCEIPVAYSDIPDGSAKS